MSTRRAQSKSRKTATKTTKIPSRPKNKPASATLADLRPGKPQPVAVPPARTHTSSYHYPLLFDPEVGKDACDALFTWFGGIHEERDMPWRKEWIDPEGFMGKQNSDEEGVEKILARRAYEVWVSEISEWLFGPMYIPFNCLHVITCLGVLPPKLHAYPWYS
jgi:A/G-specific adenine glycosylase